jgi:hypothetical protein
MSRSDVSMTIFGDLKSLAAARAIAVEFQDHVKPDWNAGYFQDEAEGVARILHVLENGGALSIFRGDTNDDLGTIAEECRDHGLSYEIIFTNCEEGDPFVNLWAPHFEEEKTFSASAGGRPKIAIEDITKLIRQNPENALKIVEEIERSALIGVSQTITASPEVIAEIRAALEHGLDDEEAASPSVA